MAYDLHIGLKRSSHKYRMSINESVHDLLFESIKRESFSVPYFNRLSDYYSDAKFVDHDLLKLEIELHFLSKFFKENYKISTVLNDMNVLIEEAKRTKMCIFGICD